MSKLKEIIDKLGLHKSIDEYGFTVYQGTMIAGDFNDTVYSYGRGILHVRIQEDNRECALFGVSSIDDTSCTIRSNTPNSVDINVLAERFKEEFSNNILPNETTLMKFLVKHGIDGDISL